MVRAARGDHWQRLKWLLLWRRGFRVARSEALGLRSSQANVGSPECPRVARREPEGQKWQWPNRAKNPREFAFRGHVSRRSFLRVVLEPCKQHSAGTAGFSGWLTVHAQCFDP